MSKNIESYEDQVLKEFESTQNETQEEEKKETTFKDLGKVRIGDDFNLNNDPEIQRVNSTMGYINIPLECLPSGGRFYPENTRISIRAARVGEIREFSIVDEEDSKDIRDKMTYIVSMCTKIYFGNTPGHYKDILEDDRIVLLFKIRELTFVDGQSSIKIPVPSGACHTPGCTPQDTIDFNSNKLTFLKPSEKLEKYYNSAERCYTIPTKSFGEIKLYAPSIGVTTEVSEWVREQQRNNRKVDAALAELLTYVIKDWRGLNSNAIFNKMTELSGWSAEKFTLVLRLKEEVSIGIELEITDICQQCGGELKIPVTFPDGFRSLFVPTISDLGDELL